MQVFLVEEQTLYRTKRSKAGPQELHISICGFKRSFFPPPRNIH